MSNKILGLVIVLVLVGVGWWYYFGPVNVQDEPEGEMNEMNDEMDESMEEMTGGTMEDENMEERMDEMMSDVKEFNVVGTPFEFDLKEIKVSKGDTVRIMFTNGQGTHDWVVDEFNARTKITQTGDTDMIEFVADKTGTFEYYCSVGNHRQMGMVGKLIVE